MSEEHVRTEEFQVSGDMLIAKIKELVHEGNIRHIAIKNEDGKTLIDVPLTLSALTLSALTLSALTLSVVGAILAPQLAAIGAIAALVTHCTIVVDKVED